MSEALLAAVRETVPAIETARQRLALGAPERAAVALDEPIDALRAAITEARAAQNGSENSATTDGEHAPLLPPAGEHSENSEPEKRARLRVVPFDEFVAVEEASAEPLLGDTEDIVIAAGSDVNVYGDGGVGKTTVELDAAIHLAAGVDWLGLRVPRPLRILVIENEGPRGLFRRKLDRRAQSWDGPAFRHNIDVLEEPWGAFSFADSSHRAELARFLAARQTDLAMSGPMSRLGTIGGGTLAEVGVFEEHLSDLRSLIGRPVALWLVHHESKSGEMSGAWERAFDTILHLRPDGRNRSRLRWQKARWAPTLHGRTWTLAWLEGQTYDVVDRGDTPDAGARAAADDEAVDWIAAHVEQHHAATGAGITRGKVETAYQQAHPERGSRARARRVIDAEKALAARLENSQHGDTNGEHSPRLAVGNGETKGGVYLYPFSHAPSPLAEHPNGEHGENPLHPRSEPSLASSPSRKEKTANGEHQTARVDQDEVERLASLAGEMGL